MNSSLKYLQMKYNNIFSNVNDRKFVKRPTKQRPDAHYQGIATNVDNFRLWETNRQWTGQTN